MKKEEIKNSAQIFNDQFGMLRRLIGAVDAGRWG